MRGQISAERARLGVLSVVIVGLVACGAPSSDRQAPLDARPGAAAGVATAAHPAKVVSAEAKAALDAGNAAFRAKDYAAALTAFEKARTLAPDNAAPWFGIYMVAQARKDNKAADAALLEIRKRPD
jgi:Tfp pilus assembly protein PilF